MILTELADAAQSAALSVVDEQRARAAAQVHGIAEAVRAAGHSLEQSQNPAAAEYINSTARQIETVADAIPLAQLERVGFGCRICGAPLADNVCRRSGGVGLYRRTLFGGLARARAVTGRHTSGDGKHGLRRSVERER